ncbi:hypothetical protein N9042_00905 [bacterium]|nr:hypothetical protein [bacterium]
MKLKIIGSLLTLPMAAQSAQVSFAGVVNDDSGSEISEWKTASTVKSLDGDGDNVYGTLAHLFYRIEFKGQNTLYTFNSSDRQVGPFAGYAVVDHPDGVSPDTQVRTTTNDAAGLADEVMFTFTALAGSPGNVRIGIATDGLNGAQFSPASIGLRQVAGSSAEHTLTSVNNTLDMVFFDVTGVLAGDQFEVFGDSGSGNFATHQIVTWDILVTSDLTDPTDSDNDGMGDNWETFYFGDLTTSDGTDDNDTDGATDLQEWNASSNPNQPDTDGDGLTDGDEINTRNTDPTSNDSDSDGLPDGYEVANNFDPNLDTGDDGASGDPDMDTLDNITEFGLGTNPNEEDTDDDGYNDAVENLSGVWFDASATGSDPLNPDTDGDGLVDGVENPDFAFDAGNPTTQPGTDPNLRDSDSDGVSDRLEIENGTDPTNSASTPGPSPNVLSADFQGIPGGAFTNEPVLMEGGSPQSEYLSGIWNALDVTGHDGTDIDPSWTDLVNALGNPTSVSVNITGVVSAWTNPQNERPIFDDYLFVNAGNADPNIAWNIAGLRPASTYRFFPYGGVARDHTMTVDTNGDGDLSDETPTRVPPTGGVEFAVTSDASGQIIGTITPGNSGEANWGGFELVGNLPGASGAGLNIEAITYDGEDVTLTWTSIPGATYNIEASSNLSDWSPISTGINAAAGPATTTSQIVDTTFDAAKFYRVVEQ